MSPRIQRVLTIVVVIACGAWAVLLFDGALFESWAPGARTMLAVVLVLYGIWRVLLLRSRAR